MNQFWAEYQITSRELEAQQFVECMFLKENDKSRNALLYLFLLLFVSIRF